MLLRRLMEHMKTQNWTAVALDFVIVVVGVFIGIQVSNWNDARREQALEREYLQRLSSDIRLSARRAEDNIASHQQQIRWQTVMLEALDRCTLDDEIRSDFARGVIRIGQFEAPSLVRGVMDELQSTGRIGVISNLELRRALTEALEEHTRRTEVLGFIIQRASPQIAYVDSRAVIDIPTDGRFSMSDLPPDVVSFDFPALCRDPHYASAVSTIRFTTAVTLSHHTRMLERYEALLRMVGREER
jgi:hypothetical protein